MIGCGAMLFGSDGIGRVLLVIAPYGLLSPLTLKSLDPMSDAVSWSVVLPCHLDVMDLDVSCG